MNRTIEDSRNYDVVCMSFGKEKERGIEVIQAGEKDSFLEQTMEIPAMTCNINDMKLSREQQKQVMENREKRVTRKAIRMKEMSSQR